MEEGAIVPISYMVLMQAFDFVLLLSLCDMVRPPADPANLCFVRCVHSWCQT